MNPKILQLQKQIAQGLASAMTEPWERIVVNLETAIMPDGRDVNCLFFYISSSGDDGFKETSVQKLPDDVTNCFVELNDAMVESEGDRWGTCDFVLDNSGKFDFKYDYGLPRRLNCVFDDTSMGRFDNYLDTYRAERAAEKGA